MKTIKPYLFTLLCLFFTSTVFLGCSNENSETDSWESNLNNYLRESIKNSENIITQLELNKAVKFENDFRQNLSICKTENEIVVLLKKANIKNVSAILPLINKQKKLANTFKMTSPLFFKMDEITRITIFNDFFEKVLVENLSNKLESIKVLNSKTSWGGGGPSCQQTFDTSYQQCSNEFAISIARAAIEAAVVGETVIGLLVPFFDISYATYDLYACRRTAHEVYEDCTRTNCGKIRPKKRF